MRFDAETDNVVFENRNTMPLNRAKESTMSWKGHISADTFTQTARLRLSEDKYALEQEFRTWIAGKGIKPKNADALFLDFCKKDCQYNQ